MNPLHYIFRLQISKIIEVSDVKTYTRSAAVLNSQGEFVDRFHLMCAAIGDDIQSPAGVACVMDWIRKVESGELDLADVDGNAWVINITRDKVWFEGLYSQGEGGEVTLSQFKLAVQTYLRFLSDPERKPIEVEFPVH